jgi:LmbE family N-acetylglucosaminyl deacetylase
VTDARALRVMSIMAHQDDFEFNAGGLFSLLRRRMGGSLRLKILATTRGASGHHELSLDETFRRRDREARASAAVLEAEYECLSGLDGAHLPGQVFIDRNTLGGLWNAVRAFSPDYIFCPPVITDPRAGIHIDHYNTAWAVRMTAYQLTVPHAYPALTDAAKGRMKPPLIITVDDVYAKEQGYDVAVDISGEYARKEQMALCHESQVFEWLPWNGGNERPSRDEFLAKFKERHRSTNRRYGLPEDTPREFFRFTFWGRRPTAGDIDRLFSEGTLSEAGREVVSGVEGRLPAAGTKTDP